MPLFTR